MVGKRGHQLAIQVEPAGSGREEGKVDRPEALPAPGGRGTVLARQTGWQPPMSP